MSPEVEHGSGPAGPARPGRGPRNAVVAVALLVLVLVVVLGGHDRPESLEGLLGVFWELDPTGLLPLGREVVGMEDLRSVERGGHARERAAGARVARRELDGLTREVPRRDLECVTAALEDEQALLRSDQKLGHVPTLLRSRE